MGAITDIDELHANAAELARQLLEQRNDPAAMLAGHQQLFHRIHAGEEQFGVPWQQAHAAVRSGALTETFEVCAWLIDINRLDRMIAQS